VRTCHNFSYAMAGVAGWGSCFQERRTVRSPVEFASARRSHRRADAAPLLDRGALFRPSVPNLITNPSFLSLNQRARS
jgi:hypothetical protein